MCFLAVLMLRRMLSAEELAKLLEELGYRVSVRDGVVEAVRDGSELVAEVGGERLRVEANDYGPKCLRDYEALLRGLIELEADPKIIYFSSPYVYSLERRRGRTRRLLEELGIEAEEVYSGHCG